MYRLSSSFLLSFTFHALIALLAISLYKEIESHTPKTQTSVYVSLADYVESLPIKAQPDVPVRSTPPKPQERQEVIKPVQKKVVKKRVPIAEIKPVPLERPRVEAIETPDVLEEIPVKVAKTEDVLIDKQIRMENTPEVESGHTLLTASPSIEESYIQEHMALIARLLQENLYYPRSARKRGITGEVLVAFRLLQNGEASAIEVRSGDREMLNRAAITTIERLSGEFPRPLESIMLQVPIQYRLR